MGYQRLLIQSNVDMLHTYMVPTHGRPKCILIYLWTFLDAVHTKPNVRTVGCRIGGMTKQKEPRGPAEGDTANCWMYRSQEERGQWRYSIKRALFQSPRIWMISAGMPLARVQVSPPLRKEWPQCWKASVVFRENLWQQNNRTFSINFTVSVMTFP